MSSGPDVAILGASFAGIEVARLLARGEGPARSVVVVDRAREHGYLPLVHERLVGSLPLAASRIPTAEYVDGLPGTRFVQGTVERVDLAARRVHLEGGEQIEARHVVVALGSVLAPPPGLSGAARLWRYKSEADLMQARMRLREVCTREASPRLAVVGGGLSGVELAAELGTLARTTPPGWRAPTVALLTRGRALLPGLTPRAGRRALEVLQDLGVEVRLGTSVVAVEEGAVRTRATDTGAEESLAAHGVFWSGGIRPAPILSRLALDHGDGWLCVDPYLRALGPASASCPGIWACGDAVRVVERGERWPTMQRAIECLWQAEVVATNVLAALDRPGGMPPARHLLRRDFPHGVSLGRRSLVVYGPVVVDQPWFGRWLRRFLMRRYQARYRPRAPGRRDRRGRG